MRSSPVCWASLVLLAVLGIASVSVGQTDETGTGGVVPVTAGSAHAQGTKGVSLERCIALAEKNYPKILEAKARRAQRVASVDITKYTPFSEFSVSAGLGLAPTVSGTADYSKATDTSLTRNMGLAWQVGMDGAIPLYTFGKITHGLEAAEAAMRVSEHEIDKERNDLRLNVRRAYYGVQLARDARVLIVDAAAQMDEHIAKLAEAVASGDGDDIQLLRMRVFRADLTVRKSEADKQEAVALSALRFLTGQGHDLDVPDVALQAETQQLEPMSEYLAMARLYRPELAMARAGVAARRAMVKVETSKMFPDLGLALSAKWSYAPEVTDQTNPFVRDSGNYLYYGLGLVARYKLDFVPQAARVSQAKSQLDEVMATEQWASSGIAQQVTDAYAEVRDTHTKLAALSEAAKLAKQWLVKVQQGIEVGTMDEQDIVDPAKEFALKRFAEMMAIYDYNVAVSRLAQATGSERVLAHGR